MSDAPPPDELDIEEVQRQRTFEYCWQRNKLRKSIDELIDAVNQATAASYPYLCDQKVVTVIVRMRKLLDRAGKCWEWSDWDATRKMFSQIRGAIKELKSLLKGLNVPLVERLFQ